MSNAGRAPAAPAHNPNVFTVNPTAFDQDYEFGRPVAYGVTQPAFVLEAAGHTTRKGSRSIRLTIGVVSSQPHPTTGKKCGCKVETYEPLAGERYRELVAAVDPALLAGGTVDVSKWAGRRISVVLTEEEDRLQTERTGVPTTRPRVTRILPSGTAAAPAAAPSASPPPASNSASLLS